MDSTDISKIRIIKGLVSPDKSTITMTIDPLESESENGSEGDDIPFFPRHNVEESRNQRWMLPPRKPSWLGQRNNKQRS